MSSDPPKSSRADVAVARFSLGGEEFAVLAAPTYEAVSFDELTPAENQVCQLLLAGRTNIEISEIRQTSVNTIENQVSAIFSKLGVASRAELVRLARSAAG